MTRIRTSPDLLVSGGPGAHYLTDLATGNLYETNATAVRILEHARRGISLDGLVASLARENPGEGPEEIEADVRAFVAELVAAGLLQEAGSDDP